MIKKFGFTLAEILVTLTIIGIVAALIVPAISNLRPDKNKTAYLQVYDTISQTVKSLASNSRLYPVCNNPNVEDNVNCSQYPLLNTSRPLDNQYNNAIYQGDRKLCSLMALSLGVAEDDINCSDTAYAFNVTDYTDGFANESFVTKNGMRWRIVPQIATYTNNFEARFQNDIYVDIDPSNNDIEGEDRSCIFDEENCTQPDIFKFMVGADGKVVPADPMGRLYISGRKSLVKKSLEEDAFDEDNVITASLPASDKVFLYSKCNGEQGTPCNADETMEITADGITCTANDGEDEGEGGILPGSSEFCSTGPAINGIPVIRSDGYIHNLRTTLVSGVYAEIFSSASGSCSNYDQQLHYMWNPDTQRFELLSDNLYHVSSADDLANNPIYQRLKNKISKTSPPTIQYNGQTYKIMLEYGSHGSDYDPGATITIPKG